MNAIVEVYDSIMAHSVHKNKTKSQFTAIYLELYSLAKKNQVCKKCFCNQNRKLAKYMKIQKLVVNFFFQ